MYNFTLITFLCFMMLNLDIAAHSKELDIFCDRTQYYDGSITKNVGQGTISNQKLKLRTLTGMESLPVHKQDFERLTIDDGNPMVYKGRKFFAFVFLNKPNLEANNKIKIVQAAPDLAVNGAWKRFSTEVGLGSSVTECVVLE